jgi:hypothetical protein
MHRVTVNEQTLAQLQETAAGAEICDEAGNVVGYFRPRTLPPECFDPGLSIDELHRRARSSSSRPFSEVIADLERRT